MLNERDDTGIFQVLEPPAGGLAALRSRIRRDQRRRAWTLRLATATAGMAVIAVVVVSGFWVSRDPGPTLDPGSDLMAIRLGLSEPPSEPVTVPPAYRHDFAVQRVPTTDDRVVFYMVGSR